MPATVKTPFFPGPGVETPGIGKGNKFLNDTFALQINKLMDQPAAPISAAPTKKQEDLIDLSRSPVVKKALEVKDAVQRKNHAITCGDWWKRTS